MQAFRGVKTNKKLVIVGDDPYNRKYVDSPKQCDDDRVIFLGYVYGDKYIELCKNAYLYVQPSELEGTSPALLAAMGYGCCVLVNGIDENIETIGAAGIIYERNDIEDLTRKLQYLLNHPEVVDEYRIKAIARVKTHFNWDVIAADMESLFLEVSKRGKAS